MKAQMGRDCQEIECKKSPNNQNKYFMECRMSNKNLACLWLDKLLENAKILRPFRIPGSEKGKSPKFKVFLDCGT
jgi:hypothetical protein